MKRTKLFSILCIGLMLGGVSCSKDEEDDIYDDENTTEEEEVKKEDDNKQDTPPTNNDDEDWDDDDETSNYKFYGAELYSKDHFMYGKFEAKMKMAFAPGCISSMFLYYDNSYRGGSEIWNEIDIEVIGKQPNGFQSNIITGKAGAQITTEKIHTFADSIASDFHIYTIEWTPDYVAWYFDGDLVRKSDSSNDTKKQVSALVKEQSLRFNLWSSKSVAWVGKLNEKDIPIEQEIDYIKVYDYNEDGTFTEKWTDDFDSFDSNRWAKGNWQMENVYERQNNVVVEDGILKLKLTKEKK